MKPLLLFILLCTQVFIGLSQEVNPDHFHQRFPPDSTKRWIQELMVEVSKGHPGFYRYTSKERFDQLIDSTIQSIQDSLSTIEYYRKLKPLFAHIGCLHTVLELSQTHQEYIEQTYDLLPFDLLITEDRRAFIRKIYGGETKLPLEVEVVAINGLSMKNILRILYAAVPSDGYNTSLKRLLLSHHFPFWYQNMIQLQGPYTIRIKHQEALQTVKISGIKLKETPSRDQIQKTPGPVLQLDLKKDYAIMQIGSFANSKIKDSNQSFKSFVKESFLQLQRENISHLIIDLRNNTGGTDGNAAFLASRFFKEPFRYWKRIEVTPHIAGQIKGYHRLFFPKPVQLDDMYQWKGARLSSEFSYDQEQQAARSPYQGSVYLLTNGLCMSSCSDVVAILSHNQKAMVIGEESGGGYQGNTSGMMPTNTIHAGMEMTIPLQKYINAVDSSLYIGRGTIPEIKIVPSLQDWIHQTDPQMEAVLHLIQQGE